MKKEQDKIFYYFLFASLSIHTLVLITPPLNNFFRRVNLKKTSTEFLYDQKVKELDIKERKILNKKSDLRRLRVNLKSPPPYVSASKDKIEEYIKSRTVRALSLIKGPQKKMIFVKKFKKAKLEKYSNPFYMDYYRLIREKIKRCAYKNFNLREEGEVVVTFVIDNVGNLNKIKIIEERSWGSKRLFNIAKKSIREASPFPSFPEGLDFPYLTFNLIIAFQYRD